MHGGYIDSILVPLHLPTNGVIPNPTSTSGSSSSSSQKVKGKAKAKDGIASTITTNTKNPITQYDIVGEWTEEEKQRMRNIVELSITLGYSTILLVISIKTTTNPALLKFPTPLFQDLDPRTRSSSSSSSSSGKILQLWRIHISDYGDEQVKNISSKGSFGLSHQTSNLFSPNTSLLSITPTSLTSFSNISLSLSPASPYSPSLITLDPSLSPRLGFSLKRGLVSQLIRAGIRFEIVLNGLTRNDSSSSSSSTNVIGSGMSHSTSFVIASGNTNDGGKNRRRNFISGAREIVRAVGGENIVLSSWATKEGEMRAPNDWINLCTLIGLNPTHAKESLTSTAQKALLKGLAMRQTYKSAISNPTLITRSFQTTTTNAYEEDQQLINKNSNDEFEKRGKRRVGDDRIGQKDEIVQELNSRIGTVKRMKKQ